MLTSHDNYHNLISGLVTKSDKIRALAQAGVKTADIARYLDIRYQHARNVLVESGQLKKLNAAPAKPQSLVPPQESFDHVWLEVTEDGRLVLPSALLTAVGVSAGERVHVRKTADGIEILSKRAALARATSIVRTYVPEGVSLADELIADRRREAEQESRESGVSN